MNNMQISSGQTKYQQLLETLPHKGCLNRCISSILNFISSIFKKIFCCCFTRRIIYQETFYIPLNKTPKTEILPPTATITPEPSNPLLPDPANSAGKQASTPVEKPTSTPQVNEPTPIPTATAQATIVASVIPNMPQPTPSASARPLPPVTVIKTEPQPINSSNSFSEKPSAATKASPEVDKDGLTALDRQFYTDLSAISKKYGLTVLHLLPHYHQDVAQAKRLIDFAIAEGIDMHAQNNSYQASPLHASMMSLFEIVYSDKFSELLNEPSMRQYSRLSTEPEVALYLIEKGANIHAKDAEERTPLFLAFRNAITHATSPKTANAFLNIEKKLTSMGATLKATDPAGKLLDKALGSAITHADSYTEKTNPYLVIAARLYERGAAPKEKQLNQALERSITHASSYSASTNPYLAIAKRLTSTMGAKLAIADPKGKLLFTALKDAITHASSHSVDANPYFAIAKELTSTFNADLRISDPEGKLLFRALEDAITHISSPKLGNALLAIAKEQRRMGSSLEIADPRRKLLYGIVTNCQIHPQYEKNYLVIARVLIHCGASPETEIKIKTYSDETKKFSDMVRENALKKPAWKEFAAFLDTINKKS